MKTTHSIEKDSEYCDFCDCNLNTVEEVVTQGGWQYCSDDCRNLHQHQIATEEGPDRDEEPCFDDDFLFIAEEGEDGQV